MTPAEVIEMHRWASVEMAALSGNFDSETQFASDVAQLCIYAREQAILAGTWPCADCGHGVNSCWHLFDMRPEWPCHCSKYSPLEFTT